jgi:two-component system, sensor histidine kinase and response regulator
MLLTILLILFSYPTYQTDSLAFDSLMRKNLDSALSPHDKIRTLNKLANEVLEKDPGLSLAYGKQALHLAQQTSDSLEIAAAYNRIGDAMRSQGKTQEALLQYFESLRISSGLTNRKEEIRSFIQIGLILQDQQNFNKALSYFHHALASAERSNDTLSLANAALHVGNAHIYQKHYDEALPHYLRVVELRMALNDQVGMAFAYNNIGFVYKGKGELPKALDFYQRAMLVMKEVESSQKVDLSAVLDNIGDVYALTGDTRKALDHYQQSLNYARKQGSSMRLMEVYTDLSDTYFKLKDYNQAFFYLRLHSTTQDSLYRIQKETQFKEIEARYESQEKERQIELLRKEKEIDNLKEQAQVQHFQLRERRLLNTSLVIGLILAVLWVGFIYQRYHERRKTSQLLQNQNQTIQLQNEELQVTNEKLKESEQYLLQLNATKDKFFSIISHDLKSPLNSLTGFLQILDMQVDAFSPDELREFAKGMNKSVKSLLELLDNLLLWSRTQTHTIEFAPEVLKLHDVVEGNINLLQAVAQNKQIDLKVGVDPDTEVYADRNMLNSVLRNLISNAIKFTSRGGHIEIEAQPVNGEVKVSVRDNGIGMNEKNLSQLFRLDTYHTTLGTANEKGNGLGLILCKEFVEKNGGTIGVESEEGKGTTFHFTIPFSKKG